MVSKLTAPLDKPGVNSIIRYFTLITFVAAKKHELEQAKLRWIQKVSFFLEDSSDSAEFKLRN
ncbi:MAG: hypothetical protein ACFFCF_04545 [Promethearchaeota archaeon]